MSFYSKNRCFPICLDLADAAYSKAAMMVAILTCRIRMVSGREFTFQQPPWRSVQELLDTHLLPAMEEQGVPWLGSFVQFTRDSHVVGRRQFLGALRSAPQERNLVELSMVLQAWQFDSPTICEWRRFAQRPMNLEDEQRWAKALGHQQKGLTYSLDKPPYYAASCLFCPRVALSCQGCHRKSAGWKMTDAFWMLCPDCSAEAGNITTAEAFRIARVHYGVPDLVCPDEIGHAEAFQILTYHIQCHSS